MIDSPLSRGQRRVATALLIGAMGLWGSAFVAMKQALLIAPIVEVMFFRLALAAVAMLPFVIMRRQVWPGPRDLMFLMLLGLLEPVLYFIFESQALKYTSASQGGLVFALLPLSILAMTMVFMRRRPSWQVWGGAVVGAGAVVMVSLSRESGASIHAPSPILGNGLELLAILCAAAFTVLAGAMLRRFSAELVTFLQCVFGATCFGAYWLVAGNDTLHAGAALGYVLYLGLIVTGGAYFAFNNAIKVLSSAVVAPFYALVPAFAMIAAMVWVGRDFSVMLVLGISLSFVAITLATRAR